MSDALTRAVAELHTAVTVEVRFYLTPRGRVGWEKTVKGVDFLDGDWVVTSRGSARSHRKARKDAFRV